MGVLLYVKTTAPVGMKTAAWILLLSLNYSGNSLPRVDSEIYDCSTLLDPSFPSVVAHGTHSLTLPDIRRYFPPTTRQTLRIPVVNPDFLSMDPLLPSPPDFQHTFHSPTLQAVDRILSHLGEADFDIRQYTDLERLVHTAHMQEIWYQASKVYTDIQEGGGTREPGLCECVRDVESNGVIRMLRVIANKAREDKHGEVSALGNDAAKENLDLVSKFLYYDFDPSDDTEKVPHLRSREDWETWKLDMKRMEPMMDGHSKYLAIYMYCMLN